MSKEIRDIYFQRLKDIAKSGLKTSEEVIKANELIKKYNWKFIHPYLQGGIIGHLNELNDKGNLTEETVRKLFISEFYDLDRTLSFIDGYFVRSKNIGQFNYYIEYSLILCFQRDYIGAINTLIPSIEGVLSSYLTTDKSFELSKNRFDKIRKAIFHLKNDVINKHEDYLRTYTDENDNKIVFNPQQINYLVSQERRYVENWYSIIDGFFKDSLFANTESSFDDSLNRHSIFHLLKMEKYYTLENYIRLFNSVKFLIWVFIRLEGKSIFNEIDNEVFITKRLQYESIIDKSKNLIKHKQVILKDYSLHNINNYNQEINYIKLGNRLSWKSKLYLVIKKNVDIFKVKYNL